MPYWYSIKLDLKLLLLLCIDKIINLIALTDNSYEVTL